MSTYYNTGTITVTNASTSATLSVAVPAVVDVRAGDLLITGTGLAVIASINSARTVLTLARAWPDATASGANFEILLVSDSVRTANLTSTLLADLRSGPVNGRFAAGSAVSPGVASGAHQTTGLFWATDVLGAAVNGTERMRLTTTGAQVTGALSATTLALGGTDVTATAAELNILDGVTATAAELNILDGVTATAAQINQLSTNTFATLSATTSLTSPLLTNAGTLALSATGANIITASTNGLERLRIDSDGRVGIRSTSPQGQLVVSNAGAEGIEIDSTVVSGTVRLLCFNRATSAEIPLQLRASTVNFITNNTERARIDASGNLFVAATVNPPAGGFVLQPGGRMNVGAASGASRTMVAWYNGGNQVGGVLTSTTATSYNTSSDYRLKEDVQPLVGASDRLMALKPVNFSWKVDGSRVDGFLAHEAQEVVPEAVTGEKDAVDDEGNPEYQGIDQSKLTPLLTAALQEALTKIEALEARVAALETSA
jgi:hypothetical protein